MIRLVAFILAAAAGNIHNVMLGLKSRPIKPKTWRWGIWQYLIHLLGDSGLKPEYHCASYINVLGLFLNLDAH